jgi:hypothetical protein
MAPLPSHLGVCLQHGLSTDPQQQHAVPELQVHDEYQAVQSGALSTQTKLCMLCAGSNSKEARVMPDYQHEVHTATCQPAGKQCCAGIIDTA